MIFVKNPVKGQVKTRIAKVLGEDKALEIYKSLCIHTCRITKDLPCDKAVFYSDFITKNDLWEEKIYHKYVQTGNELGGRMKSAFAQALQQYQKVLIIGSDNPQIQTGHLTMALKQLDQYDVVIGPATDGGYYLLGLKKLYPELFLNKKWSTNSVLKETIYDFKMLKLTFFELPELTDVDEPEDLRKTGFQF